MPKKRLHVVHCVDVEGPMTETLEATWERVQEEDGLDLDLAPTLENLQKIQAGGVGRTDAIRETLKAKYSAYNLGYLEDWGAIDKCFADINSKKFRHSMPDCLGQPYVFSWFIYDHFGFTTNPRYHDDGIHKIFDHYHDLFLQENPYDDGIYWHYHHVPSSGDAVEWNTNWFQNGTHEEILARRLIERNWFPSVFRAGGHIERNDLSFWMEMFIPFDYSCQSFVSVDPDTYVASNAASVSDWRGAPIKWGWYHPDWYDYRLKGEMKRYLFRCLDLRTWISRLTEEDVRSAFEQADDGEETILAYYNHDYRPMADDIDYARDLIARVAKDYPDVEWRWSSALDAAQSTLKIKDQAPIFNIEVKGNLLMVSTDNAIFGPEPFLAIQEEGRFFRDNLTREGDRRWAYAFRKPHLVEAFGVAACSPGGEVGMEVRHTPFG